jgi:quinol monooxygenase YgiN
VSNSVSWLLEFAIKDGQRDNFDALLKEMIEATQANEPGALNYEWFINPDGKNGQIYERYTDSAATMAHLGGFGEKFAERFLAVLDPTKFFVYGSPSDDVKAALEAFGPVYMKDLGGFTR